jgi:hypothetical protein
MGPPIMVCYRSGGSPRVGPVMMAPEPPPRGEGLRLLNQFAMNSRLPKRMVSPKEKCLDGECSPPVAATNADDRSIGTV